MRHLTGEAQEPIRFQYSQYHIQTQTHMHTIIWYARTHTRPKISVALLLLLLSVLYSNMWCMFGRDDTVRRASERARKRVRAPARANKREECVCGYSMRYKCISLFSPPFLLLLLFIIMIFFLIHFFSLLCDTFFTWEHSPIPYFFCHIHTNLIEHKKSKISNSQFSYSIRT